MKCLTESETRFLSSGYPRKRASILPGISLGRGKVDFETPLGSLPLIKQDAHNIVSLFLFKIIIMCGNCDWGSMSATAICDAQRTIVELFPPPPWCAYRDCQEFKASTLIHWAVSPTSASFFLEFFLTLYMLLVGACCLNPKEKKIGFFFCFKAFCDAFWPFLS